MLHYKRRQGQGLVIGKDIIVTVIEIRGDGTVRLGITAPRSMTIDREEIHLKRKENANATGNTATGDTTAIARGDDEGGDGKIG